MAVTNSHKKLLAKLKQQVRMLQKKEEQGRNQLRAALKKIHKLGRTYKLKLDKKVRLMRDKVVEAQSSTYAKAAADFERSLLKNIETKGKALVTAVAKIEKKHAAKLSKSMAKKGKKPKRRSKVKQEPKLEQSHKRRRKKKK